MRQSSLYGNNQVGIGNGIVLNFKIRSGLIRAAAVCETHLQGSFWSLKYPCHFLENFISLVILSIGVKNMKTSVQNLRLKSVSSPITWSNRYFNVRPFPCVRAKSSSNNGKESASTLCFFSPLPSPSDSSLAGLRLTALV